MRKKRAYWLGCLPVLVGAADVAQVMAQNTGGSTNWSGYAVSPSSGQSFTDVSASWTVPTVHPPASGTDYSLDWVGLDGDSDGTVEQCGTTGFVNSEGQTEYVPWYEFAPASLIQITSFNVNPGDKIFAEVTYEPGDSSPGNYGYDFIVDDETTGNSFNQVEYTSTSDNRSSAEWIAEAPSVGGTTSTLANFGSVTFSGAVAAQTGGSDQAISSFTHTGANTGYSTAITMYQNSVVAAFPSPLNSTGEAFNVTYGSGPAAYTWDNAGGAGPDDGKTWDVGVNNNWNSGTDATFYSDGSKITFNDANNGNYNVTLNSIVSPASVTVSNSSGNYTISGTGGIHGIGSLTKSGSRTLTLSTANTYTGGTNVTAGTLIIEPTSSTTSALPRGALTISGGELQLADNVTLGSQSANTPITAPTSNVNITSLSISGSSSFDITNNHVIIDYSGTDPISSIATWIKDGAYGSGTKVTWTGTGITSSAARSNSSSYGIGYADSADAGNPAGLAAGQIEVMYTLLGDANLDGKVNGTDFNLMATNFNQSVTAGWDKGDFNYDGKVNGNDFVLLAANFNEFASQSAVSSADLLALDSFAATNDISLTSIPEPATAAIVALAGFGLLRRGRKSRPASGR